MLDLLTALGITTGAQVASIPEMLRKTPGPNSSAGKEEALINAAKARAASLGADPVDYYLHSTQPGSTFKENFDLLKSNQLAGHIDSSQIPLAQQMGMRLPVKAGQDVVMYNPNSDAAFLAHELGHGVSAKSKVGKQIRNMRSNPKLALAGQLAGMIAPLGIAAAIPGDEDLGASMGLAYGAIAPALIDEALATKNGLAIMKDAGMSASRRQKARMAAAYMSYATAPLFGGLMLNKLGNVVDTDVAQ
jgi:hypothetical protein